MTSDALDAEAKPKTPVTEGADPDEVIRQAQLAAQAFSLLLKGIKNISIYRHNEARFPEYLEPTHKALRWLERITWLSFGAVLPPIL